MNASNKEVAFVGTGIPPGCMGKVCGSVVWALPMQRDSKGQPTHSGSRLYPGSDIQLQSVSKTASKAESIEEEDNKKPAGEQRPCESESVKKGRRVCVEVKAWGGQGCEWKCVSVWPSWCAEWAHSYTHIPLYYMQVDGNASMDAHILDSCRLSGEIPAAGRRVGGDAFLPETEGSGKPPKPASHGFIC